ncbi:hypothetical protein [Staphylococcus ureilyticus]|uniref:hypothetical protein n=1 Tax=Staphylococcus ureilyticus TaxID=94138 RepID=UPI00387B8637
MSKVLYALLVVILFVTGLSSLFYGLLIFWEPLAYIVSGLFFIGIALILNQAYDNTSNSKGGDS